MVGTRRSPSSRTSTTLACARITADMMRSRGVGPAGGAEAFAQFGTTGLQGKPVATYHIVAGDSAQNRRLLCFGVNDDFSACGTILAEGTKDCGHMGCKRNKFVPPAAEMFAAPAKSIKSAITGHLTRPVFFCLTAIDATHVSRPDRRILETELITTAEWADFLQDADQSFAVAARAATTRGGVSAGY